jgi:Na+/melibiose symporter-like transporter
MRPSTIGFIIAIVWSLFYAIIGYGEPIAQHHVGLWAIAAHVWNALNAQATFWCIFWFGEWLANTRRVEAEEDLKDDELATIQALQEIEDTPQK